MKKFVIALSAVISLALVTGCGSKNKTLDCTKTENQSGIKMEQRIKATFKGTNVEDVTITMDAVLGDEYKSYKSIFISSLESSFSSYKGLKGVTIDTTDKDDTITVTLKADLSKMDDEAKKKLDVVDTKASYKESKKDLEKEGYTCK